MSTVAELGFVAPTSIDEAVGELADPDALLVGGGTSVGLLLKNRLVYPSKLIYLGHVPELHGIEVDASGGLRIGATTTLRELVKSPAIAGAAAALVTAASMVGNARVRSIATVGGGVVHGDPRQDLPPVLLSLGAEVEVTGPNGLRTIPIGEFFISFMEAAIEEDEIVTAVRLPAATHPASVYRRFTPGSDDDYPTVSVALGAEVGAGGVITTARLGIGGAALTAVAAPAAAALITGRAIADVDADAVAEAAIAATDASDDRRGSANYKRQMVGVMTKRAIGDLARVSA